MENRSQDPVIVASGVCKTYHTRRITVEALQGVDVPVGAREMVAVMGAKRLREDHPPELPLRAGRHRLRLHCHRRR